MKHYTIEEAKEIITGYKGRHIRIMEVCGTHTHEIFKLGIRSLLPESIELISGPGCPVCVTPVGYIDEAVMLALEKNAIICTFGDLIRVPGTKMSLADARRQGGDIRMVYSPMDALDLAKTNPDREVVFLAVGFETTTPVTCLSVKHAIRDNVKNFSILTANKTMPNAYMALKDSADAFLYPGHVNAITGESICREMLEKYGVSGVIAGFTAEELMDAIAVIIVGLESGKPFFENCYKRVVREDGNVKAVEAINEVMESIDTEWRGLGIIPQSGLKLRDNFATYDARKKFALPNIKGVPNPACRCGDVLQGKCKPSDCKVFGKGCTPQHPVGACMVSDEGACSAYYQYGGTF
ncbi:MAG: hydrogenase formation protein HypD [Lachnospiraceae bacterium]|nr:hydrogenase formation protein HypD [Lachnospiraceae bacterium]